MTAAVFRPDHVPSPGSVLVELLETRDMSARELARRCGRSAKMIVEIIAGKAPIEPETALQLGRVFDLGAETWLALESLYRLHLAALREDAHLRTSTQWIANFPLDEMRKRKLIPAISDREALVPHILKFFGVGTVAACHDRFSELANVSYRHSPSFTSTEGPLLVWLRISERRAENADVPDYNRKAFAAALRAIRGLTTRSVVDVLKEMSTICGQAGVFFDVEAPFKGMALSGASRWLGPRRALIQQTMRHKTNDHFWFTFFHEAAHLLLHSRRTIFLDGNAGESNASAEQEAEANDWAANFLVPQIAMKLFIASDCFSADAVKAFATHLDIAPGIIVGQLQRNGAIPFAKLNNLKETCSIA